MADFDYVAIDPAGRERSGKVRADTVDDARARLDRAGAFVRFDLTADELEQRRLARAVAADQCQPVARGHMEVDIVLIRPAEQPAAALLESEVFPGKNRGLCHCCGELRRARLSHKPSRKYGLRVTV